MREHGAKGCELRGGKPGWWRRNDTTAAIGSGMSAASSVCAIAVDGREQSAENAKDKCKYDLPRRHREHREERDGFSIDP